MAKALLIWIVLLGVVFPHGERLVAAGLIDQLVDTVGQVLTGGSSSNGTITGWTNATSDPCQDAWTGILCTNGTITGLVLSGLNLVGSVPSSLAQLPGITTINMSVNDLTGSIPSLANLTQLLYLDLSDNSLNGSIPSLSDLTSLLTLDLSGNQLEGSIPSLSSLTSLTYLNLSHNLLTGVIPDLSALSSLVAMDLSSNQLSGSIPLDLSGLTSLVYLDLSDNNLTGIIPDLSTLTSLEYLDLSNNKLAGAIPDLRNLTSLRIVNLSGNNLTVEDLSYLALLSNLTTLVLSDNPVLFAQGIPSSLLDGVTSLAKLYLNNVGAKGLLPDLALGSLELLSVESNLLCGVLPEGLSEATSMQGFDFEAGCNCFFESWCSSGACSNFKSYATGALCDTSRCAQATECPISTTTSTGSVLQFLTNVPDFTWEHPAPAGEATSNVTVAASLVSLTEIDQSGSTIHTEDFPAPGSYLISTNTTIRSNGASVDEITFKATLGNGAEVSVTYYISADSDFTQLWGDTEVEVPRNSLKYTFNARGWPFASADNRLRLRMDISSLPAVQNSSASSEGGTSDLSLRVGNSSASINVQLYRHTLVYSNVSSSSSLASVAQPSGAYRSEDVNSSLSDDLGSIFVDFPSFDAHNEVLSYDPSLGVLFGDGGSGRSGQGSSDSSTWIIAVAVAVPVAVVAVVVAAAAIWGVGWWRKHNYVRRSEALRGSMVNIAPDEGLEV